jgi:hypothetical protein
MPPLFSFFSLSSSNEKSSDIGDFLDFDGLCGGRADEGEGECANESAGIKAGRGGGGC